MNHGRPVDMYLNGRIICVDSEVVDEIIREGEINGNLVSWIVLQMCLEAMRVWRFTYADDMCSKGELRWANAVIADNGGTLKYIAEVSRQIEEAIEMEAK